MQTTPAQRIADHTSRGWWGDTTLLKLFDDAVTSNPDHPALIDQFNRSDLTDGDENRLTFQELADATDRVAGALYAGGIRRDDIVVVQLPNIAELPVMYLAIARLGAIISPVPMQYGLFELRKADEALNPSAFVSLTRFKGESFAADHCGAFADSCTVFAFGDNPPEGTLPLALASESTASADYAAYVRGLDVSANDILTICWTSGTTGQPKGVPRSHNMWIASARGAHDVAEMKDNEAILNPFPMVNMAAISGFLFPWLMRSSTLVLHHPFDLPVFLQQLEREKIAYTIAPPAVLNMLLKQRELLDAIDISNLRSIGSGSAPLSPWMVATFQNDYGIGILNIFGSNEGICLASDMHDLPDPADRAQFFPRFGVAGFDWRNRAGNRTVTRLVDLQTREVVTQPGGQGELEITGSTVFDGYWKSPEANKEVFTEDGYFKTGDVFEIVDDGGESRFYKFTGRCKDIIVRGGVNISPDEIDTVLAGHPKVAEVGVVGYDDEIMGEKVGAVIVAKTGETVTLDELNAFLRDKGLAVFKLPEQLRCVEEIPHNATGKVMRRELKQLFSDVES